jgi:predicted RND superfamily exporter protein
MGSLTSGQSVLHALCRHVSRHPGWWLFAAFLVTVPSIGGIRAIRLDTDLIRLLPQSSRAARATAELESAVGGASNLAVIFESDDPALRLRAIEATAERVSRVPGVASLEYEYPVDFIEQYRFLLIPSYYLTRTIELVRDRDIESDGIETFGERQTRREIQQQVEAYGSLNRYHASPDGRAQGIFIRARRGVTSLSESRRLFTQIEAIANDVAGQFELKSEVRGSLRNKIDEFDVIVADLRRTGLIAGIAILVTLVLSFASARPLPVLLVPLVCGLLWAFALVPQLVGPLNLITAFLVVVMFGMGIDYSIHLVKRFQAELGRHPPERALIETYRSTGRSVVLSAATTGLALLGLALSDLRGFSEFGIVGAVSVVTILAAMMLVMPPALIVGERLGIVRAASHRLHRAVVFPNRFATAAVAALAVAGAVLAFTRLSFNYDFTDFRIEVARERQIEGTVYRTSGSPAAVFLADDSTALDELLGTLENSRAGSGSTLGRIASVRDLAPTDEETARRVALIADLRAASRRMPLSLIRDPNWRRVAEDLRSWTPPVRQPAIAHIPDVLRTGLVANDGSGRLVAAVYPSVERKDGRNAMAFTEELYGLELPAGVAGPVGETPVVAEMLWLVTAEGPWLLATIAVAIVAVVVIQQRSIRRASWMLLPLAAGLALCLGTMALLGWTLNVFSLVAIPPLLGLGVDHGVHYYSRWRESGGATRQVQTELAGPLTVCTLTTIMGYVGMAFASHPGLRSIGAITCLGLACMWLAALGLLPGLLALRRSAGEGGAGSEEQVAVLDLTV